MDWSVLGTGVAVVLTLMVYSYLIGDSFVFRLAEHLLVGVSVGWAFLQILFGLVVPAFTTLRQETTSANLSIGSLLTFLVPIILGVVMLLRPVRRAKPLTNLVMALVIGTVAALSLVGAVAGTIVPQVGATMLNLSSAPNIGDLIGSILLILGTLLALWYFQFTVRKASASPENRPVRPASGLALGRVTHLLGRWSIMLAFGAVFGAVFLTYFAALVDRLVFLVRLGS